ncbi:MAG: PIN domain-containing protein [Propionibacteriaceae bacterium]|nr:PIN domain-containing protein [Propionibacteriaceae bacterium]
MNGEPRYLLDTSVAVPLLMVSHEAHAMVDAWATGRELGLAGHALAETYSVLTRFPGEARISPADAVKLIDDNFPLSGMLSPALASQTHRELEHCGVSGGATYDGLVALAAREHEAVLVTRDARAQVTYHAVGAQVIVLTHLF